MVYILATLRFQHGIRGMQSDSQSLKHLKFISVEGESDVRC